MNIGLALQSSIAGSRGSVSFHSNIPFDTRATEPLPGRLSLSLGCCGRCLSDSRRASCVSLQSCLSLSHRLLLNLGLSPRLDLRLHALLRLCLSPLSARGGRT